MRKPRASQHVFTVLIKLLLCPREPKFVPKMHVPRSKYSPDMFTETCEKAGLTAIS